MIFQDTLDFYRQQTGITGVSAAVYYGGNIWKGSSGWIDTINGVPVNDSTIFSIGSITKTLTSVLVLKCAEKNLLHLSDSIGKYLNVGLYPNIAAKITIKELLNHTSGLYDYVQNSQFQMNVVSNPTFNWPNDSCLYYVQAPYFSPGTGFAYSNTNYILLGLLLKNVLQLDSIYKLFRDSLFVPSSLMRTFLEPEMQGNFSNMAHPHFDLDGNQQTLEDGFFIPRNSLYSTAWTAGAVNSTAEELLILLKNVFSGSFFTLNYLDTLTEFQNQWGQNYGCGVAKSFYKGYEVWGHSGNIRGYSAIYYHLPLLDITLCVLANDNFADINTVALKLLDLAIGYVLNREESNQNSFFVIYPVPATNHLSIHSSFQEKGKYSVYDISGKEIFSFTKEKNFMVVDISFLPEGTYFLTYVEKGKKITRIFQKQ